MKIKALQTKAEDELLSLQRQLQNVEAKASAAEKESRDFRFHALVVESQVKHRLKQREKDLAELRKCEKAIEEVGNH